MLFHANALGTFAARSAGVPVCIGGLRVAEKHGSRLLVEKHAIRRMNAVVCVSRSVERFAHDVFGESIPSTHVIGNAIDVEAIDKIPAIDWTSLGWPGDAQVLLFVGRLHRQKGLDVLVEAIEPLLSGPTDSRAMRCLLVGDGPQRDEWNRIANRLGPARFQLTGWRSDSLALIKGCRLLVLPSRYEGMPNAVLEAMAAGKPVAATAVEGVTELLGDAAEGQTCPPEDPAALRELIRRLWQDPQAAREIGLMNRQRAADEHQIGRLTSRYRELYAGHTPPEVFV
jgi:glycosyltransferase involved in cell wall biosynthesis